MKASPRVNKQSSLDPGQTLTIRLAVPADAPALVRLAQRDSAPPPAPAGMLVAEVGGELRAAVSLLGGAGIADPFHHTAELVAILRARARQLRNRRARPTRGRLLRRWAFGV
jgi:hypothetical protein